MSRKFTLAFALALTIGGSAAIAEETDRHRDDAYVPSVQVVSLARYLQGSTVRPKLPPNELETAHADQAPMATD